ncbi:hypothetical protein D0T84_10205 [Dysgonomonas sp. 521]|nr:hypothetical protein [Dysgonomonas sp. 521]
MSARNLLITTGIKRCKRDIGNICTTFVKQATCLQEVAVGKTVLFINKLHSLNSEYFLFFPSRFCQTFVKHSGYESVYD